jgi:hypothetical protein
LKRKRCCWGLRLALQRCVERNMLQLAHLLLLLCLLVLLLLFLTHQIVREHIKQRSHVAGPCSKQLLLLRLRTYAAFEQLLHRLLLLLFPRLL